MSSVIVWFQTPSFERDMLFVIIVLLAILAIQCIVLCRNVKKNKKKCDCVDIIRCKNCMYGIEYTYPESGREAIICNYAMSDEVPEDGFCYIGRKRKH